MAKHKLEENIDSLRTILEEEKKIVSLHKVAKPSLIEKVFEFDYSYLDTLTEQELQKYLGALSQYLIYINKHINQLNIAKGAAEDEYKRLLNMTVLSVDKKVFQTLEERKTEAQKDETVGELKQFVDKYSAQVAVYKNIPESINNLIQTIKKIYDAKIRERFTTND